MACIMKNKLTNGNISYTIQVKVKDLKLNKTVTKTMTWKKPPEMTEYQVKRELTKISFEFEEKVRNQAQGKETEESEIGFIDYTEKWLKRVKIAKGIVYYKKKLSIVKKLENYFGNIKLKNFTPSIIQQFIDNLYECKITHKSAKLKSNMSLKNILKIKRIKAKHISEKMNVNFSIYFAVNRGEKVLLENAEELCRGLEINFDDYFDKIITEKYYTKETISKHKKCLSLILGSAKRQRLIDHNYASSEYIMPITGTKKEIEILNDEEAKQLKKALDDEPNIQWKTSLYIVLLMGLRRGELCGLEWKDIDFKNKTLTIQRSSYDVSGVGMITKDPKTYTSHRTLSMPDILVDVLNEYKEWYDKRKEIFNEIWKDTDRLFVNDEGEVIRPQTFRNWLKRVLKKSNIKSVTLHSLRHTNITLQLISGVDLRTVSARAGHARTSTTTDIYSHFLKISDNHASAIINNIFTDKEEISQ